ncbi:unnamed protein product, partial [Nesidiocoris tenuis]
MQMNTAMIVLAFPTVSIWLRIGNGSEDDHSIVYNPVIQHSPSLNIYAVSIYWLAT